MSRPVHTLACASLVVALLTIGCTSTTAPLTRVGSPPYEPGSGVAASVTRPLAPFTEIVAISAVRVTLVAGERDEAVVTTDDNLLASVVTEVRDGTLLVTVEGGIETRLLPTIALTASRPVGSFVLEASAELTALDLDLDHLSASLSSATRLESSGRVASLELVVTASSTADLRNLTIETAAVSLTSASTAFARVTGAIHGACLAGSTLHLIGSPSSQGVTTDVSSKVVLE